MYHLISIFFAVAMVVPGATGAAGHVKSKRALSPGTTRMFKAGEMVWIPAGSFEMGSVTPSKQIEAMYGGEARHFDPEHPAHRVTLTHGFWLGKYRVTNKEFAKFVDATHYQTEAERDGWAYGYDATIGHSVKVSGLTWRHPGYVIEPDQPVVQVSWHDAQAYIRWLNTLGDGVYALPTEAQWEYACRAGTTTAFSFGDDVSVLGAYAWYGANGANTTHPVGQKKPNPWGLYGMHGNVWDWCQDWFGPYPAGPVTDPTGPKTGKIHVIRGGSWHSPAVYCRSANRRFYDADARNISLGIRLVRRQD